MNNRKPRNSRGKLTRAQYAQFVPEKAILVVEGRAVANPDYPGKRRIIHDAPVPQGLTGKNWGA